MEVFVLTCTTNSMDYIVDIFTQQDRALDAANALRAHGDELDVYSVAVFETV